MAAPRSAPESYASTSGPRAVAAAATAAAPFPERFPENDAEQGKSAPERATYQRSLFLESGSPKVIPIPTLTPLRVAGREAPPLRRATPRSASPRSRRGSDSQQALEFQEAPAPSAQFHQSDGIYCDAPVALPAHRMIAAAVDTSVVLLGLGVFLGIFFLVRRRDGFES